MINKLGDKRNWEKVARERGRDYLAKGVALAQSYRNDSSRYPLYTHKFQENIRESKDKPDREQKKIGHIGDQGTK